VEVTVKKLHKPAIVYIFRIALCSSLIGGVASVAKCWRQKNPKFHFRGELYSLKSTFHLVYNVFDNLDTNTQQTNRQLL